MTKFLAGFHFKGCVMTYKKRVYSFWLTCLGVGVAFAIFTGCASVDNLEPPKFSPPISDYVYGDTAIVNSNGIKYDGFFDGKIVKVVGARESVIQCEYNHGDHIDSLSFESKELIKERK